MGTTVFKDRLAVAQETQAKQATKESQERFGSDALPAYLRELQRYLSSTAMTSRHPNLDYEVRGES